MAISWLATVIQLGMVHTKFSFSNLIGVVDSAMAETVPLLEGLEKATQDNFLDHPFKGISRTLAHGLPKAPNAHGDSFLSLTTFLPLHAAAGFLQACPVPTR
ncbi:hypothetical protein AMTR_s00028p00245440 [Amborella trichopoda]|uniref:Uncharacterized protein n=1 Tax=Amborella trichopoda TaxID=13333 RepID=W1PTU0_AMBTC|nr:hypothetical protein AMTR_s00028p00245440 [Amborella trichopoda]